MPNHDARAVANRFIGLAEHDDQYFTHMQLQKLVYISHGWNFAFDPASRSLIIDTVEAWIYGPVIPCLWDSLKRYGKRPVTNYIHQHEWKSDPDDRGRVVEEVMSQSEADIIRMVYDTYGEISGEELSDITHEPGTPWQLTYRPGVKNIVIPNALISSHYEGLKNSANA